LLGRELVLSRFADDAAHAWDLKTDIGQTMRIDDSDLASN
jgi:hypothetical protein